MGPNRALTVGPEALASWAIKPSVLGLVVAFPLSRLGLLGFGSEGFGASVGLFPAGFTLNPSASQTLGCRYGTRSSRYCLLLLPLWPCQLPR